MRFDINEYEAQEKIEILKDIYEAEGQIKAGKTVSHTKAKNDILKKLMK